MAKVFTLYDATADKAATWPQSRTVASGGVATIATGVPVKESTGGNVVVMVDSDGTTSQKFTGIAKNTSTDTASAAGTVDVFLPFPGIVYSGFAKSSTAADTLAEINALQGKRVVFDLTSTDWTVDTGASNATTNGVCIIGGDYRKSVIYFVVSAQVTSFDNPTTA